jgi:hypothetical protein
MIKTYPVFSARPYGLDLPRAKTDCGHEDSIYNIRRYKVEMKAAREGGTMDCCGICGKKVNVGPKTVWGMVDMRDCTWATEASNEFDFTLEPIGADCARKYMVK